MSWSDPCSNCGQHRADCDCGNWNGNMTKLDTKICIDCTPMSYEIKGVRHYKCKVCNAPMNTANIETCIEDFLIEQHFEIEMRLKSSTIYKKSITDLQHLYVKILPESNKIVDVEYENEHPTKFDKDSIVSFETIKTFTQLQLLIKALTERMR